MLERTWDSSTLDLNCMLQNPAFLVCVSAPFVWLSKREASQGVRDYGIDWPRLGYVRPQIVRCRDEKWSSCIIPRRG